MANIDESHALVFYPIPEVTNVNKSYERATVALTAVVCVEWIYLQRECLSFLFRSHVNVVKKKFVCFIFTGASI